MMGTIKILPGTGDPTSLAPFGPGGVAGAPAKPPFTLTPVDYDPYALTPSGLVDVTQPFGLNDPARFEAAAPGWAPFRSVASAPSLVPPSPSPDSGSDLTPASGSGAAKGLSFGLTPFSGLAANSVSGFAPSPGSDTASGANSGLAPNSFSGFAPSWGSTTAAPPPSASTGVGDTMDQVEGGGPATAGDTDIFGRPLDGRGLDDFKQVGRDVLNKAANGMLLGFAPRIGAAVDYAVGRAPTYDAALASRYADQAQADADMGPLAPVVEMAGGALLPWGDVSEGLEGLTISRRLLTQAGIGGGMGAIYGVGASPDLTNLAQTLQSMARSGAMGGVLGVGLPYVAPLAAGLAGTVGHYATKAAGTFYDVGTSIFNHGASAHDGGPGGANTGRFLQADPFGTQGHTNLYAQTENVPANLIDPWGLASLGNSTTGFARGLAQSIGSGLSDNFSPLYHGLIDYQRLIASDPEEALRQAIDSATGVLPELAPVSEELAAAETAAPRAFADGSFSISDWTGYPEGLPKPSGPFRLLEGQEYIGARKAADKANKALHASDRKLKGFEMHEIHPVKFGGSPTDPLNKIPLTQAEHQAVSNWWYKLQRELTR